MKTITPYSKSKGDMGVDFAEKHFLAEGKTFIRASKLQDLEQGIDCFIDTIPTDIKNTNDIYICQILTDSGKINVRHPFKTNSKVTHYCVVDVPLKGKSEPKFVEHINIKERLLRDFIKDEANLKEFYKTLKGLEKKNMKDFGVSQSQACLKIKQLFLSFLKPDIGLSYVEPSDAEGEISFRLFKAKASKKSFEPVNLDIKSILSKYKKEATENPTIKENIVYINV